jgi:ABC-type antimicrobial peptide transport system permease subunit
MKEVLLLFTIGLAVGVPAAIGLGRYVSTQLYGVQPNDPSVGGVAVALLSAVAVVAGLLPARHASRIDPLLALRYE